MIQRFAAGCTIESFQSRLHAEEQLNRVNVSDLHDPKLKTEVLYNLVCNVSVTNACAG